MLRVENVATPATAATVVVPARAPPPGFVLIAAVTLPLNPVAVLPCASWTVTCTAGVIVAPAAVQIGCAASTVGADGAVLEVQGQGEPVGSPALTFATAAPRQA